MILFADKHDLEDFKVGDRVRHTQPGWATYNRDVTLTGVIESIEPKAYRPIKVLWLREIVRHCDSHKTVKRYRSSVTTKHLEKE